MVAVLVVVSEGGWIVRETADCRWPVYRGVAPDHDRIERIGATAFVARTVGAFEAMHEVVAMRTLGEKRKIPGVSVGAVLTTRLWRTAGGGGGGGAWRVEVSDANGGAVTLEGAAISGAPATDDVGSKWRLPRRLACEAGRACGAASETEGITIFLPRSRRTGLFAKPPVSVAVVRCDIAAAGGPLRKSMWRDGLRRTSGFDSVRLREAGVRAIGA